MDITLDVYLMDHSLSIQNSLLQVEWMDKLDYIQHAQRNALLFIQDVMNLFYQ
jgi:hypothetical protein